MPAPGPTSSSPPPDSFVLGIDFDAPACEEGGEGAGGGAGVSGDIRRTARKHLPRRSASHTIATTRDAMRARDRRLHVELLGITAAAALLEQLMVRFRGGRRRD